ncbi:MAG: hypothetical protein QM736_19305 [Vicinamibacterales bacterium]
MIVYIAMPSLAQWQHDSSVALAVRRNDKVLTNVDDLVGQFEQSNDNFRRLGLACSLYFALDYWLKMYRSEPTMARGRAQAMEALYKYVTMLYLCDRLQCTINTLPRELELLFGRELSACGRIVDGAHRAAEYLTRAEASKYKLSFKDGKAYQYPWWEAQPQDVRRLAESSHAATSEAHNDPNAHFFRKYGFFTMSMGQDIYMAKHYVAKGPKFDRNNNVIDLIDKGIYHSSYLAGIPAMFAGSMLIEGGVIKGIRSDSGHYQPADVNTASLLRALSMMGVPINQIEVYDYVGTLDSDGDFFLANNGSWQQIAAQRTKNVQYNNDAAHELAVEQYMREHLVDEATARQQLSDNKYTVKVGKQKLNVVPIKPIAPKPAASRRDSGSYDLE